MPTRIGTLRSDRFALAAVAMLMMLALTARDVPPVSGMRTSVMPDRLAFSETAAGDGYVAYRGDAVVALDERGITIRRGESPALAVRYVDANPAVLRGSDQQAGLLHVFSGQNAAAWRVNVPTFGAVTYEGLFRGVSLTVRGSEQAFVKSTYTVAAGADPGAIGWRYEGAALTLRADGALAITLGDATLVDDAPVAWQVVDGSRVPVGVRYALDGEVVRFAVGSYDDSYPLVIDPNLGYSTYVGGGGGDSLFDIDIDAAGNTYVVGESNSTDIGGVSLSQAGGGVNVLVRKLSPNGKTIYTALVGGGGDDRGYGIAVAPDGAAYVTGVTNSDDFPVVNDPVQTGRDAGDDGFVFKLDPAGNSLGYSTYLGGNTGDLGIKIAVNAVGEAYVIGRTGSADFPTSNAYQSNLRGDTDAFLSKLSSDGKSLLFSTYFGGDSRESGEAIELDAGGVAYIAGWTSSTGFPISNALQAGYAGGQNDAFVARFSSDGSSLVFSTYLGGSAIDEAYGLALDNIGNVYVTGGTSSTNFPLDSAIQETYGGGGRDVFVTYLSSAGNALLFSSYFGGNGDEQAYGVWLDSGENVYVSGYTWSTDFPLLDAVQTTFAGGVSDVFAFKLLKGGTTLSYSTYHGGAGRDNAQGLVVDNAGNTTITGFTDSGNLPVVNGTANRGGSEGFVVRLQSGPSNTATPTPDLTGSAQPTATPTATSTATRTPSPTATITLTPSITPTPSDTPQPTETRTPAPDAPLPTSTFTPSATATETSVPTATPIPPTPTPTPPFGLAGLAGRDPLVIGLAGALVLLVCGLPIVVLAGLFVYQRQQTARRRPIRRPSAPADGGDEVTERLRRSGRDG